MLHFHAFVISQAIKSHLTKVSSVQMNKNHRKWYSMDAGLINTLGDGFLIEILNWIPELGRRDINHLLRVSKRFYSLASSDSLWISILGGVNGVQICNHWLSTVWLGSGRDGDEASEWLKMREDAGLPLMNMFK